MTTTSQPPKRVCFFCDETKLTREHLWPNWIVRLFEEHTSWTAGSALIESGQSREWLQSTMESKSKCVCKACNEGWMSNLEQSVKPILAPLIVGSENAKRLSGEEQRILASWVILRSMIWESQAPEKSRYHSVTDRRLFAAGKPLVPPQNAHVWLASFPSHGQGATHMLHTRVKSDDPRGFAVFSGFVGEVALQVFFWRGFPKTELTLDGNPVIDLRRLTTSVWNRQTIQIWPVVRTRLRWPPEIALCEDSAIAFLNRFVPR